MAEAPERIWAFNAKQTGYRFYANGPQPEFDNVEYVRADLAQAPAPVRVTDEADARFAEWFRKNYPGPDTIIHKPDWHAPKIFRAAVAALEAPAAGVVAELVDAHRENARVLGHLHNDLQGRVDAAKLAALFECLARSTAALALIAHNTTEG